MPPLTIGDLPQDRVLDRQAMAAVRGGFANTSVLNQLQFGIAVNNTLVMPISVLNGSYVGAPVSANLTVSPRIASGMGPGW
jgi:hypothetical protein